MADYITNSDDTRMHGAFLKSGESVTLRVYSDDGAAQAYLNACRADFGENAPSGEESAVSKVHGQYLLDDGDIEGKLSGGVYQNICGFSNALDLGAISAGGYKEVVIKSTLTYGTVCFGLAIRSR